MLFNAENKIDKKYYVDHLIKKYGKINLKLVRFHKFL